MSQERLWILECLACFVDESIGVGLAGLSGILFVRNGTHEVVDFVVLNWGLGLSREHR